MAFEREFSSDVRRFFENLISRVFVAENLHRPVTELRKIALNGIAKYRELGASVFTRTPMVAAAHAQIVSGFLSPAHQNAKNVYATVRFPYLFNPVYLPDAAMEEVDPGREERLREMAWANQWIKKIYGRVEGFHMSMGSESSEYIFDIGEDEDGFGVRTEELWQRLLADPVYPDTVDPLIHDAGYYDARRMYQQ